MPIFSVDGKRVLFIHVPKTGGMALARHLSPYMVERFDTQPPGLPVRLLPRHFHAAPLEAMLDAGMFDWVFMVVRHPADRLVSEYRYQKRKPWKPRLSFGPWLRHALWRRRLDPYYRDNHFRPQTEFECFGAEVFRYEDGLERVVAALNQRIGTDLPVAIVRENVSRSAKVEVGDRERALIEQAYAEDYRRYGYAAGGQKTR